MDGHGTGLPVHPEGSWVEPARALGESLLFSKFKGVSDLKKKSKVGSEIGRLEERIAWLCFSLALPSKQLQG